MSVKPKRIRRFLKWFFSLGWIKSHFFIGSLLVIGASYIYMKEPDLIEPIQNWTFDTYQRTYPRIPNPQKMIARAVIIDIDEPSLETYGQWPWPRTVMAKLVENLRAYQVLVIGFDIVFAEPDRTSPKQLKSTLADLSESTKTLISQLPDHDAVFAEAISKGRVVLGQVGEHVKYVTAERLHPKARFGARQTSFEAKGLNELLKRYPGAVLNLPELEAKADGIGLFSTLPDRDGIYRKVALLERVGNDPKTAVVFPALSLEMIRVALGGADSALAEIDEDGIKQISLKASTGGVFKIPTDKFGRIWVHFARYSTSQPPLYISAKDVLEKTANPELLGGALAVVGTSAIGLKDIRATPINGQLPGVEVHTQVMETILSDSHLNREVHDFWKIPYTGFSLSIYHIELLTIIVGGLIIVFLLPRLNSLLTLLAGTTIISGLVGIGWYHYLEHQILIDYAYPGLSVFTIFVVLTYLNYMREEAQKKQIRTAFGHYVSPALLAELADHPEKLVLGGETRHLTILFSDIRGFTTISERFNAQELTRFINRFLTPMTNVIMTNSGTVDKYMGDAIMAFWNAPLDDPMHPINACHAALEMQKAVKELNQRLTDEANLAPQDESNEAARRRHVPIHIGVGINSGMCCVGNMGSDQRFDYSALGDDVNLASRLEGQSKTYGVDIVLGEKTVALIKDEFAYIELDLIQVKGKTEPVRIYSLLGTKEMRTDANFRRTQETMNKLLAQFRAQQWEEATRLSMELAEIHASLTELAQLYIDRIAEYKENPPPHTWDGVYIATTK